VAEQLTFELAGMPPATFATFAAGPNAEAVQMLLRIASRDAVETGVVLWGAGGAGKTHLLRAAASRSSLHIPVTSCRSRRHRLR
jgi:DnaA family protein